MIITVIGGSAHSTPVFADALGRSVSRPVTLRLAGRSAARLSAVARACALLCEGSSVAVQQHAGDEWRDALSGCDIVLIQVRVGGYKGRDFDERFPLASNVPGDEGLGPGGLSAAVRAWPEIRAILTTVRETAPNARVILLTSPGSLLIRLASAAFPDMTIVHPCELPFATLRRVSDASAVPLEDITFDYAGVNHLGWLYDVRADGEDVLTRLSPTRDDGDFPSANLVTSLRAFPLKYLRLHYEREQVLDEQRRLATSRAEELSKLASWAFTAFQSGSASTIRAVLRKRRADWYPDAVAPLVRAWMGDTVDTPLFLTVADTSRPIAERRYRALGGELAEVRPQSSPDSGVGTLLEHFMHYEQVAASAVVDGSEAALAQALSAHPWVSNDGSARRMARKMVAYARAFADETGAHAS